MTDWFAPPRAASNGRRGGVPQTREAETAALDVLRAELEARGVSVEDGRCDYGLPVVDPDGNQVIFNSPGESA